MIRDALRIYPNNYSLLSELALALTIKNNSISEFNEAITLSEEVLDKSTNEKVRSTTKANLCQLYLRVNEYEKGFNLINRYHNIWECREMLVPNFTEEMIIH